MFAKSDNWEFPLINGPIEDKYYVEVDFFCKPYKTMIKIWKSL
jgi:hypothetical protein